MPGSRGWESRQDQTGLIPVRLVVLLDIYVGLGYSLDLASGLDSGVELGVLKGSV